MTDDIYEELRAYFDGVAGVEVKRGRGAQGMKAAGKMFAMFGKDGLLLRLDPAFVTQSIEEGRGQPYDPGTGKVMPDRLFVSSERRESWLELSIESARYFGVDV